MQYSDADDLVFLVAPAPSAYPSAEPSSIKSLSPSEALSTSLEPSASSKPSPERLGFYFVCADSFSNAVSQCMNNPPCPTGTECEGGDSCWPIYCTECPEIDCYAPTSSPTVETHTPSNIPSLPPSLERTQTPSSEPSIPLTESPSAEPSASSKPSPERLGFYFVCAASFSGALSQCMDNPPCPTGTECEGGDSCWPIHCKDCPDIDCDAPTSSPSTETHTPTILLSTEPSQEVQSMQPSCSIFPTVPPSSKPSVSRPAVYPPSFAPTFPPTSAPTRAAKSIKTSPPSISPSISTDDSSETIAIYDAEMRAPRCSSTSLACSSGDLLAGVSIGQEPNSPNTVDGCEGEGTNWNHDESVDQIVVRGVNGELIAANSKLEVEINVSSAKETAKRSIPFKWSVAHVYFAPTVIVGAEGIDWVFLESFVVEPESGSNMLSLHLDLPARISNGNMTGSNETTSQNQGSHSSAIRVNYGYALYQKSSCASDGIDDLSYLDVDDLVFEVAAYTGGIAAPTPNPAEVDDDYFFDDPTNSALYCWNSVLILMVAVAIVSFLLV